MSGSFPNDRQLAQLSTMLDGDAMVALVRKYLHIEAVACTPKYIRYKPETSCIVQYDLTFDAAHIGRTTQCAFIKVYADQRGRRTANSGRATRLRERLADISPTVSRITFIPELEGVFQVYPADLDLRSLARLSQRKDAEKLLRTATGNAVLRLAAEPEMIRYKPGRKALLRFRVDDHADTVLFGKTFEDADPAKLKLQTVQLIRAGVNTPAVVGINSKYSVIVHEEAAGAALNQIRNRPEHAQWMTPLAETLWQLQGVKGIDAHEHRLADEIDALHHVAALLSRVAPELAARLHRATDSICRNLSEVDDTLVTSHGDFYDDQAMVSEAGLTLIDLDEIRLSHPLLDVGNMLAHLTAGASRGDNTIAAHAAFHEEAQRTLHATDRHLALFEAVGLLKLASGPFRSLESNWLSGIDRIMELIELLLAAHVSGEAPHSSEIRLDPKLPQLSALMRKSEMSAKFADTAEAELSDIELVRHKPGRRAILRYGFSNGERLYGKTFASNRGARVFRVWNTIAQNKAFGANVIVPEPLAWIPEYKLFLTREVVGNQIEGRLLAGDTELAERIAFTLYQLHSSDVHLGRWHDIEDELEPLAKRCEEVGIHAPELGFPAKALHDLLMRFDTTDICWRYRPIHRDIYHEQLLTTHDQLVVLDLDDASMSEPMVDTANFVAHLMLLGIQHGENADSLRRLIDAFIGQYRQLDDEFDDRLHRYLIATTLLRLAGIHVSRENGAAVAGALIEASVDTVKQRTRV